MNKILIEIICPSLSRRWDFWAAVDVETSKVAATMISEICEYENDADIFKGFERIDLYNKSGMILNPEFTLRENGVHSGDSVMII